MGGGSFLFLNIFFSARFGGRKEHRFPVHDFCGCIKKYGDVCGLYLLFKLRTPVPALTIQSVQPVPIFERRSNNRTPGPPPPLPPRLSVFSKGRGSWRGGILLGLPSDSHSGKKEGESGKKREKAGGKANQISHQRRKKKRQRQKR